MQKVRWCMVLAAWINSAPAARWTKTRYRLAVARDFCLAIAAMFALLAFCGFILYKFDSNRRLVRILTGAATDRFDVYLLGAMVGSLASVGCALPLLHCTTYSRNIDHQWLLNGAK